MSPTTREMALIGLAVAPSLGLAQITAGPLFNIAKAAVDVGEKAAVDGSACDVAGEVITQCFSDFGGPEGVMTVAANDILACACCSSRTPISDAYSSCASYISAELPVLSTEYEAFSGFASLCAAQTSCGPNTQASASATASGIAPTIGTTHPRCTSLANEIIECASATPSLATRPIISLAGCFCYSTAIGGSSSYVGASIQSHASVCASWASSAGDFRANSIAVQLTTMCDDFSSMEARETSSSSSSSSSSEPSSTSEDNLFPFPTRSSGGGDETPSSSDRDTNEETPQDTRDFVEPRPTSLIPDAAFSTRASLGAAFVAAVAAVLLV